jgi:hypothetical protein
MKAVIKTAVAVTAFGLAAAALAAPAQAQTLDRGNSTVRDVPQSEGSGGLPVGNLLGGLTQGGLLDGLGGGLLGGLLGGSQKAAPAQPKQKKGEQWETGRSRGPAIDGRTLPLSSKIKDTRVKPRQDTTLQGAFASVAYLVEGSFGGAMASLSTTRVVPGSAFSVAETLDTTTDALNGATGGAAHLSVQDTVAGVSRAAKRALPASTNGRLAPLVGRLVPAEAAPVVESLPGTTQVASIDEIAPLIEDAAAVVSTNGTKATSAYTDTVASLGWTTAALTSMVRGPWYHR